MWSARSATFLAGLLLGFCLAVGFTSKAQVSLSVFGKSWHSEGAHCQTNPGLGINYDLAKDWRAIAGWYKNSMCDRTTLAGVVNCPWHWGRFCAGFAYLRLTGYSDHPLYVPLPIASYQQNGYAVDALFAARGGGFVVGLGLRIPLWN